MTISELKHPEYKDLQRYWPKWRLTYEGGDKFVEAYVKMFSQLENVNDFADRKAITYVPAFAKAAVIDAGLANIILAKKDIVGGIIQAIEGKI